MQFLIIKKKHFEVKLILNKKKVNSNLFIKT